MVIHTLDVPKVNHKLEKKDHEKWRMADSKDVRILILGIPLISSRAYNINKQLYLEIVSLILEIDYVILIAERCKFHIKKTSLIYPSLIKLLVLICSTFWTFGPAVCPNT